MDPTHSGSNQGSPFIRGDIALVPPSPELGPSSHYDSVLDFPNNALGSPNFVDNSGSFHGSPFSRHSELSFVTADGGDLSFELFSDHEGATGFDNLGSAGLQPGSDFDYDPLDFDAPHSGSSLMIYDNEYMSPPPAFGSPSPDQHGGRSGSVPFDYSSPASTNDDSNDRRSRASSVSSAHRGQQSNQYYHSPRLDVAQSFENMTVRSPNWGVQGLPQTTQAPQHKAPSPPRLVMPDGHDQPPTINVPDDMDGGPQLHIVPATPIGIVGASGMGAPFQNPLDTLNQGSEIGSSQPSWAQSNAAESSGSRQASPFRFPANLPDDTSNNRHSDFLGSVNSNTNAPFLFPQQQRHRSKSDNALDPPTWDTTFVQQQLQQQGDHSALGLDLESAVNVDDTGMNTASSTSSVNPNASAAYAMQTFQFGGGGFLSPNSQDFGGMRRSKSENGQRMGHRQSRSEDIRGLQHPGLQLPPQQQQQQQQQQQFNLTHSNPNSNFGHGHSLSLSASRGQNLLYPPSNDYMAPPQNPNLLSTNNLPIPSRASSPGHIRRASSGSRSGRGIGAESWMAEYGPSASSARASPYPSPNASPRVGGRDLDLDLERENQYQIPDGVPSAGFENEVALSGRTALNAQAAAQVHQGTIPGMSTMPMGEAIPPVPVVSKPNVTTLRTANASHKRRKQEASFMCPFPGCGSTFTRSFNLKGHIRSHNEEKPFVCHWPGCGKGFARQHDCKRHEQLHTNYRPFTCEGCNRQFARMDALNRHLRSEGGTECAKLQSQGGSNAGSTPGSATQSPPPGDRPVAQQQHQRSKSNQDGSPNPTDATSLMFQPNSWNQMQGGGTAVGVSL